ncbi:efflux RND transporter periplasmic adaptor subunit [Taibaiella chishuiensis]|uniref:RND family efflux transporter MFP subunit n=1 Tax=Taibaiella chishuiensis TaxID=1434707 RepID=A0A2P8D4E6_9BACT|nr:efflux RND transporter periplasmic adaptor subunit [Taibaiella chishuiensis]PSK92094.1 RND family efflux transporter MFP subunit [Taibaiella chishuiensis]
MKTYPILFLALCVAFAACSGPQQQGHTAAKTTKEQPFTLATVRRGGIATRLSLPAQLAAYQEVNIFPKVNGYVQKVYVDIGSRVTAGTLLMTLEAPELQQLSAQAREQYAKAAAELAIDKEHYQRLLEASGTPGAISPLDLSTLKAKMDADNAVCNAEKSRWQMQQTMQGYLEVRAPFSGVITARNVHPGVLVSAADKGLPMLELKQSDMLRLRVEVPETQAATLTARDSVSFLLSAFPGKKMTGIISRRSDNVDARYRNERIEIDVPNKDDRMSPGMYADVILDAPGDTEALIVPRNAVVTSTEGRYVLRWQQGRISKVNVATGNAGGDSVQIYGALQEGDQVIAPANEDIAAGEQDTH